MLLLKLGQREHMEQFRKGLLYMNPLKYFRDLESDPARADRYEGATHIFQPKDAIITLSAPGGNGSRSAKALDETWSYWIRMSSFLLGSSGTAFLRGLFGVPFSGLPSSATAQESGLEFSKTVFPWVTVRDPSPSPM